MAKYLENYLVEVKFLKVALNLNDYKGHRSLKGKALTEVLLFRPDAADNFQERDR